MGIYSVRLEEAEEVYQGPDAKDIGADLDAIEQAVEESHDDEVEDAASGEIDPNGGDNPIEEMAYAMYEAEYNYSQIMQAIGLHELNEAAHGREVIYEAGTVKEFFGKVKEFFLKMFRAITDAVKKVINFLDVQAKLDKKFVSENKKYIIKGATAAYESEGYKAGKVHLKAMTTDISALDAVVRSSTKFSTLLYDCIKGTWDSNKLTAFMGGGTDPNGKPYDYTPEGLTKAALTYFADYAKTENKYPQSVKDFADDLKKIYIGEAEDLKKEDAAKIANTVCDILAADRETASLKKTYAEVKKDFADTLQKLKALEAEVNKAREGKNSEDRSAGSRIMSTITAAISGLKTSKNLTNTVMTVAIKTARIRRVEARGLAHKWAKHGGAPDSETQDNGVAALPPATNESASFLRNVKLI